MNGRGVQALGTGLLGEPSGRIVVRVLSPESRCWRGALWWGPVVGTSAGTVTSLPPQTKVKLSQTRQGLQTRQKHGVYTWPWGFHAPLGLGREEAFQDDGKYISFSSLTR